MQFLTDDSCPNFFSTQDYFFSTHLCLCFEIIDGAILCYLILNFKTLQCVVVILYT